MPRRRRLAVRARSTISFSCPRRWPIGRAAVGDELVIVSAADSGYFPLLRDLVLSIRDKDEGRTTPIGTLDLGLSAEQRAWLGEHGVALAEPGWDVDFARRKRTPLIRKAQIARPFLRRSLPGYATFRWLHADAL